MKLRISNKTKREKIIVEMDTREAWELRDIIPKLNSSSELNEFGVKYGGTNALLALYEGLREILITEK